MLHSIRIIPSLKSSHYLHNKFPIFAHISHFTFSSSAPKISIFDYLVNQHQFSPESASKVSSLLSNEYLKKPQNADSVLNFLKESGFSKNHIEVLVQKVPWVISTDLERTIKPKIKVFQDLGFHSTDLADFVCASPFLLRSSADRLGLSVSRLKNVLGPHANICRVLTDSGAGRFLARGDLDRTLIPNVEYLKSCGICSIQIARYIYLSHTTFLAKPEKLKDIVKRVEQMGVDRQSKLFLCAVKTIGSMSRKTWELKLKLFRELGFSEENISYAFGRAPGAFAVSERKIKEVTQLLLSVDDFSISDIVCTPVFLTYSLERRFKPRICVLKALQSKNLLKKKPSFGTFFLSTDTYFRNKYVIPYLEDEVGDLYVDTQSS